MQVLVYNHGMTKQESYIITGPTASGKSDFAHRLACEIGGAIINCDSVQMYSGIENISASPFAGKTSFDNIDGVPYRLFSVLPLSEQISVADYLNMARHEYESAIKSGYIPIFVGGTGYYINALIKGISPMPDISLENRTCARELVARDINAARKLLPDDFTATDSQRVARALEVFFETGRHLSEFQSMPRVGSVVPNAKRILICPETSVLHERIALRIPQMVSSGALVEAERIIQHGWNPNRAIGATQLCAYLRGDKTYNECVEDWINKTNQYAKRQRTWFRTQFAPDIIIHTTGDNADIKNVV